MSVRTKVNILTEAVFEKIEAIARTATAEEIAEVEKLVARAKSVQEEEFDKAKLTPAMAALLFVDHNRWNRQWMPNKVLELARRMKSGAWRRNGQGMGLYKTGLLSDAQHRLAAAALAGYTLVIPITLGIDPEAVDTIDDGTIRQGYVHAAMSQLKDTKQKQAILKVAAAYFAKLPEPVEFDTLGSAAEYNHAIKKHDDMLSKAIDIALAAERGCAATTIKKSEVARTAFIMLYGGRSVESVTRYLHRLQEGTALETEGGEMSPVFKACEILGATKARGRNMPATKQVGIILKAMIMMEAGSKASARVIRADVDKALPNPTFVPPETRQAAE